MANASGASTFWNDPNFNGTLYNLSLTDTPFLAAMQPRVTHNNIEFACSSNYALEAAAQPAITETASLTAPTPTTYVRAQERNVTQIFQEQVSVSDMDLANGDRLKWSEVSTSTYGYTAAGDNPVSDKLAFQIVANKEQMLQDFEYSALLGTYSLATTAGTYNATRGIITASTVNAVAAGSAALSVSMIDELLRTMSGNGARFMKGRFFIFAGAKHKQEISKLYSFVPMDRNFGGQNIRMIETDFAMMAVVYCPKVPVGTILIADMSVVRAVHTPVPGKSYDADGFALEDLSKTGMATSLQLSTMLGIDYGSANFHGKITGLAT